MKIQVKKLKIKNDSRGSLVEILHPDDVASETFGMILVTTAFSNEIKGGHYHKRKTEWYCVVKGKGLLTLIDRRTNEEKEINMGGKNMVTVKIPPNYFHKVKNIGLDEMYLLVYVDEPYNLLDPDTYYD